MTKDKAKEAGECEKCAAYRKKRGVCISCTFYGENICPKLYERSKKK
jgi:hypothetical protein